MTDEQKAAAAARLAAARAAKAAKAEDVTADTAANVSVRVLPLGADKIATGRQGGRYGRGETFVVAREIAEGLEAKGLVEIQ